MDGCRRRLRVAALLLFSSAVGCNAFGGGKSSGPELTKFKPQIPADAPNPSLARGSAPATDSRKKELPKPSTLCAVAAVRDQMAANPELSFAVAEQTRAQARQAYQQAIALDPKYAPAYIGLAKSYAAIDDAAQAGAMYEKAIERMPKDANIWYEKALMHARFKEWDNAIACFRQSQKIDPDNRLYVRMMGMTQARAGRFEDALDTLAKCMKEEEARFTIARMYRHLDQPEAAQQQLMLALRARPTYAPARELLMEMQSGNPGKGNAIATVDYREPGVAEGAGNKVRVDGIE